MVEKKRLFVLAAVLGNPARFREIRVVVFVLVFDHGIDQRSMRKLIGEVAMKVWPSRWASRGFAFNRAFFRIAIVTSRHKVFSMTFGRYELPGCIGVIRCAE